MAINIPMSRPPARFAERVPKGMVGKIEFNVVPNHHRTRAPVAAPQLIDRIDETTMGLLMNVDNH
jgi:hypothetical protein